jgi:hypothetical protein
MDRNEVQTKFEDYITSDFQEMLDSAVREITDKVAVQIEPGAWEIVAHVPIVYSAGGWYSRDTDEKIVHITVSVDFRVNGALQGTPQRIKFSPAQGFYNLKSVLQKVMHAEKREQQVMNKEKEFNVHSIMNREYGRLEINLEDYRVQDLIRTLVPMGFTGKSAQRVALETVQAHPTNHDLNELLDVALEHPGKELESESQPQDNS